MDNIAGRSGGAVSMNSVNTLTISTSNAITSYSDTLFARNTCMDCGGALSMNTGSILILKSTTTFDSNYAQRDSGAIAASASTLTLGSNSISFINNSALSGSAMYRHHQQVQSRYLLHVPRSCFETMCVVSMVAPYSL